MELYIGLMSGTSADGIDAALVDFSQSKAAVLATHYAAYPIPLREKIVALYQPDHNEIQRLGELDCLLGNAFAQAANALLTKRSLHASQIKAIGSHGQTIRHYPTAPHPFTLQIADPNIIAARTGITTIADFRRKDIAHAGQGAPLVPAFHHHLFATDKIDRAIVNIGGIANVTLLPKNKTAIQGFDTGPGNALMDAWIHAHLQLSHDENGEWAAQGAVDQALLTRLLTDEYFHRRPPKSTGREYFNLTWLKTYLEGTTITPVDVQATLAELTAQSIISSTQHLFPTGEMLVCGGGVHNDHLMKRLQTHAKTQFNVASTHEHHVDPDWIEAAAFAWIAKQTLHQQPGNLKSVTGATHDAILGGIYYA